MKSLESQQQSQAPIKGKATRDPGDLTTSGATSVSLYNSQGGFKQMALWPGTPGAPVFTGKNVGDFLEEWDEFSSHFQIPQENLCKQLVRYVEKTAGLKEMIKELPGFETNDWHTFRTNLMKSFSSKQTNTESELAKFVRSHQSVSIDLYYAVFKSKSKDLIHQKMIGTGKLNLYFVKGLNEKVQRSLSKIPNILELTLDQLFEIAKQTATLEETEAGFQDMLNNLSTKSDSNKQQNAKPEQHQRC